MECRSLDLRKKYSNLRVFCLTIFEKLSKNDSFFSLILEKIEQNIKKQENQDSYLLIKNLNVLETFCYIINRGLLRG